MPETLVTPIVPDGFGFVKGIETAERLTDSQGVSYAPLVKTYDSASSLLVDPMAQSAVVIVLTHDTTIAGLVSPNLVDGRMIKWRITASGSDRSVTWPDAIFKRPSSSSMAETVVVAVGTTSIFLTEYDVASGKWFLETYVWGY